VDFAKSADYTVLVGMTTNSKKCFYYRRLNKTDYKIVLEILKREAVFYDADVIFDATGVGAGLADFLSRDMNAYPYKFTNESKNELINKLIIACEYSEIELPNIITMRNEFEIFTYTLSKTGKMLYSAPEGKHDDCVVAVALANWYACENSGKAEVQLIEDYFDVMNEMRKSKSAIDRLLEDDD
jgi:phage FluMu gp28-like protein